MTCFFSVFLSDVVCRYYSDTGKAILSVSQATIFDTALYVCAARNEAGEARTSCRVVVKSKCPWKKMIKTHSCTRERETERETETERDRSRDGERQRDRDRNRQTYR